MSVATFKAVSRRLNGFTVESEAGGFKIIMDEPESAGGANKGMTPMDAVLCALGACQTVTASLYAKGHGIDLEEFWVELEGDLDLGSYRRNSEKSPMFEQIRFTMHIKSNSPKEKIENFIEFVEGICPVGNSLKGKVDFVLEDIVVEQ